MVVELLDQCARNSSRGQMGAYFGRNPFPNEAFVTQRLGSEAAHGIAASRRRTALPSQQPAKRSWLRRSLSACKHLALYSRSWRESFLARILGSEYELLQIGRFRVSGEVHYWMYDRESLGALMTGCGLHKVVHRSAAESYFPNWSSFNLDTEPDGAICKPDSLFIEAMRP